MEAVLEDGELVAGLERDPVGGRLRDPLEPRECVSQAPPEIGHGRCVRPPLAWPDGPLHQRPIIPAVDSRRMSAGGHGSVLVADDDEGLRLLCRVNLELDGYRVLEAANAEQVERVLAAEHVDVVLLDVHLGSDDGLALARTLRETRPEVRIAFFTGSVERPDGELVDGYVAKPFTLEDLTETVRRLARV